MPRPRSRSRWTRAARPWGRRSPSPARPAATSRSSRSERAAAPVALGRLAAGGTLLVRVPDVPRGDYRIVVTGSREAPVLEVVALGQETSVALVAFGFLFILVVLVAGIVIHRRWRDAIS